MISVTSRGSAGLASSSDQIRWRSSVRALMTTIGCAGSKLRSTSVIGTAPVRRNASGVSSPGTFVTILLPGLKPSLQLYGAELTGLPKRFFGIQSSRRASRLPVGLVESARVKWSFGHGYRQAAGSSGSHANAAPAGTNRNAATTAAMSTPARIGAKCYQRATGGAPVDELQH